RLHLSAVLMLAPHLTPETAPDLLAGAAHKTRRELEYLLAEHFPRPDVPTSLRVVATPAAAAPKRSPPAPMTLELAPGRVDGDDASLSPENVDGFASISEPPAASGRVVADEGQRALGRVLPAPSPGKLTPLSPGRVALRVTLDQSTVEILG